MQKWKEHLLALQDGNANDFRALLESIVVEEDNEYSEFFKFLSAAVKIRPKWLDIVIERILKEWQIFRESYRARMNLFKSTVSFLGRLKKSVRREGMAEIAKLWPFIFNNFPNENRLKLLLVREYRRDLPFHWLLDFTLRDEFFYSEDLNAEVLDCGGEAVIEILVELLEKARRDSSEYCDELRVSGILEKIGSLWRSPSLKRLLKLLALASSISNNIFDSLPALLNELVNVDKSIWRLRLVDSLLNKYPKKQYVLSQLRAELTEISGPVVSICGESLVDIFDNDDEAEMTKATCSLLKSVLERWDALACTNEVEINFSEAVRAFLERAYKYEIEKESGFKVLYVFSRYFVPSLQDLLLLFFRNAIKYICIEIDNEKQQQESFVLRWMALNSFTRLLVFDGGTDLGFVKLFRTHPSLIADIHALIDRADTIDNEAYRWEWILSLAESPRTKNVLIDFLVDPKQVHGLVCDSFWLAFISKLVDEDNFERINRWMGGNLPEQFFERAKHCENAEKNNDFYHLLKIVLPHCTSDNTAFILKSCKGNSEMFNWILTANSEIANAEMIYDHLTELFPFGDAQIAKRVHELIKNRIRKADELVDCLFAVVPDRRARAEWNLLIEAGAIEYAADAEIQQIFTKDYGRYLEQLYAQVADSPDSLIKDSSDPVEMYLEYYKYGQIRAMTLLQAELLKQSDRIELLLRIPMPVLRATGSEFGGVILDHFLVNGLSEKDLRTIEHYSGTIDLNVLKLYYKNRINM